MPSAAAIKRVLIVEDLQTLSIAYAAQVEKAGYQPVVAATAAEALKHLTDGADFAAILLDLQLPDADGLDLLRNHPQWLERFPVIVATADASLARAIAAMRLGAFDYLVKPLSEARLVAAVDSAVTTRAAARGAAQPGKKGPATAQESGFIGQSPQMLEIYRQIGLVADSRATVMITGETGTGKEVCAETIHRRSGRRDGPFVAINCGAIPDNLLESEIFGHMRGAFTGATEGRIGAAQAADKGTLFLDEVCEMPLQLQVKLLRFLQTGTIQRLGSDRLEKVDVRIVCATNRDPRVEVMEGRFREDLYYRLAVIPLEMPPLRERGADIRLLADEFLARFSKEVGKTYSHLTEAHYTALERYPWPGNVRELQNVFLRAVLLNEGPGLPLSAIPVAGTDSAVIAAPHESAQIEQPSRGSHRGDSIDLARALAGLTLAEIERIAIEAAIEAAGGNLAVAAHSLGISASTIYRKRHQMVSES